MLVTESATALIVATMDELRASFEANRKSFFDAPNSMTSVGTGQQATASSVGATASSPQVPVVVSSASAPTQPSIIFPT